jgi:FlaA1/EpsC-like NDP-sugar epimerase
MKDETVLITGGTGSWGNELTKQLMEREVKEIRIFSRNEFSQVTMERKFNDKRIKFVIGDVREPEALMEACKGVTTIFHLAALKHIPVCERYPWEAIRTNIEGTRNVIEAAIANRVSKVIDVSSDKAVSPLNLYGMTKAVGEKLIIQANERGSNTTFICIRGGNVLGSNGSVVPHFLNQIHQGKQITITDERMTRYFLTLREAISLLFVAAEANVPGTIFVMRMPACKIRDLALVLIMTEGSPGQDIKEVGIRQGEKLHEVLISREEAPYAYEWGDNYYVIDFNGVLLKEQKPLKRVSFSEYNSGQELMDKEEIEKMLIRGGFLR